MQNHLQKKKCAHLRKTQMKFLLFAVYKNVFIHTTIILSLLLKAAATPMVKRTSKLQRDALKTSLLCLGDIRITYVIYSEI